MTRALLTLCCFFLAAELDAADGLVKLPTGPDRLIEIKRRAEAGEATAQKAYADELNGAMMFAAAEHWCLQAAKTGDPAALCALGEMYHANRGFGTNAVKSNFTPALELHQLAALQGHQTARSHLAHAYMNGSVYKKDVVRVYYHFKLAAKTGLNDQHLKRLVLDMSQKRQS